MAKKRLEEIRKTCLEKVEKLREMGVNPYPSKLEFERGAVSEALRQVGKEVAVAGRIKGWRGHGSAIFADLIDETGKIQIFFQKKELGEKMGITKYFDIGDLVLAGGKVFKTESGELTINVGKVQLLAKSTRPLPEKWHGLKDVEERYRRRYLDIMLNPEVKQRFMRKAKFWEANRAFMKKKGFVEVETPILEHVTGGADAKPFVTHHNALGTDFYLRISTELYLKRLIGAGFEKVYTLGPNFRNEGIDDEHLQEYYQIEWYWAYVNYRENMKMVREMMRQIAEEVYGKSEFERGEHKFDLSREWEEIDYVKRMNEEFAIDILSDSDEALHNVLKKRGINLSGAVTKQRVVDNLWKVLRKKITGPAFLINEPKFMSPLAKSKESDPRITERFHVVIAGSELGNGYSELNDPVDQLTRFREQERARQAGDEEAQMMDMDYIEMLEYGMPPTSGYAHSERLFWFLEGVSAREGVLFPQMRRKGE